MKYLLMTVTLLVGLNSFAQQNGADPGRSLTNPSDTLQENDCVFKNKGVAALAMYEFIVDKCDRRYTPSLMIIADHLPKGGCVYDLVQKMTGKTIARVVSQCAAAAENNQEIQGIIPDAPLEQIEEGDHLPQIPGAEAPAPAKKPAQQKAKPQQQQQPEAAAKPAATPKKKEAVKPKTNDQVEKGNDGYYINPDEIEF